MWCWGFHLYFTTWEGVLMLEVCRRLCIRQTGKRHRRSRGWEMKPCSSSMTSSPTAAALVGAACCQLEAAGWCLWSPQGQINPELCTCLHWETDEPSADLIRLLCSLWRVSHVHQTAIRAKNFCHVQIINHILWINRSFNFVYCEWGIYYS